MDCVSSKTAIFRSMQHRLDRKSRRFFSKVISGPRGRVFKSHHSDQYKCPETVYSCGFRAFSFVCVFRRFSSLTHTVTHTGFGINNPKGHPKIGRFEHLRILAFYYVHSLAFYSNLLCAYRALQRLGCLCLRM